MTDNFSFDRELGAVWPRLRRFAHALARDPADADDLAQAAAEKAFRSQSQFQAGTRFDSWMFRVCRTVWIDMTRSRGRRWAHEAPPEAGETVGFDPRSATEAAIDVTAHDCASVPATHVPIGAPIDNLRIYILDALNQPQPIGVAGELYIAGDGLARGYLKRPELTAERFVADPFVPGERMYRSGDLARWNDDGTIDYLGRIDTQVKLRGQRIELGEIEACLEACEGVETAAVLVQGEGGAQRLIAAYHPAAGASVDEEALRAHAATMLPAYMVPSAFVAVAEWPMTTSGKTDRRALVELCVARDDHAARLRVEDARVETIKIADAGEPTGHEQLGADERADLRRRLFGDDTRLTQRLLLDHMRNLASLHDGE